MKKGLFDLGGKVAIVTGGNGGIGLGMAAGWPKPMPRSRWSGAMKPNRSPRSLS